MENKKYILVGFDIYKFVEKICDQFLNENPKITNEEIKAYKLGMNSVLRLLHQTVNEFIKNDIDGIYTDDEYIAVHVPNLEIME